MMPAVERQKFLLWAQDEEFLALLADTEVKMSKWGETYKRPMISVSGGKDSTVMLHMALRYWPGESVVVWHWDYGAHVMPEKYASEIIRNTRSVIGESGARLVIRRRFYTPNTCGWHKMFGHIKYIARDTDRDCSLVGLRATESGSREKRTRYFQQTDSVTGLPVLYPMREWKAGDIWAYTVSHNLPYHSSYDEFAGICGGYDTERLRFSVFCFDYSGDGMELGLPDGVVLWRERNEMEEM